MLSIAIPSRNEKFLRQTILDVLENATGEIEIFPILDGYEPPAEELVDNPKVHYLRLPLGDGKCHKRQGINLMVEHAKGEYVATLDAHCMVAKGFDEQLAKDHQPNWVQTMRRNRLDAENWCLQEQNGKPPIDYEYIMFQPILRDSGLHGFRWDAKTIIKTDVHIDDVVAIQGSFWFMTKDWFKKTGFMQVEGYTGWGQEGEEITLTTWLKGGRVVVNKNTWYAHLHKGIKYGRMYYMSRAENRKSYAYSYNKWIIENKEFFIGLMDKFMPMPNWPKDWKDKIWKL
jgi:hypothetical protein